MASYEAPGYRTSAYQAPEAAYQSAQVHNQHAPAATPLHAKKQSGKGAKTFLLGFAGAALACIIAFSGFGIFQASQGSGGTTVLGASTSTTINASDENSTLAETVAKKALPSVVNIDVYTASSSQGLYGSSNTGELTESSLGSGVVLSEDGYIITNYHVIEGADKLQVAIGENTYDAFVIGTDSSSDIAVIKAENASGLTPIEIGSSSDLVVGQWVMSIGSPFGLEQSVATGIVSATSRSQVVESETTGQTSIYTNLIQTDAAINPGNSGGALVDRNAKLVGINTLIASYSGNYSGVGFAIPIDYAISIAEQLIAGKTPTHAQLGVSLSTVNSAMAQRYGLSANQGAYVAQVQSGSGAANAGIRVGDIITKADGQSVASASDLMLVIRSKNPGDTITIELNRDGQTMTVTATLGSDASSQSTQQQSNRSSRSGSTTG